MIHVAHISDSHFDARGRLDDVVAVHEAFLKQARERDVDLIVHAGDWFERRSMPEERWAVARFLQKASEVAPVFGVKGNHDQPGDLDVFNLLETEHRVYIVDRPSAQPGSAIVLETERAEFGLLALPWHDKAHLVAGLEATVDQEQTRQLTIAAARDLLTCLRAEATRARNARAIPILVGHVMVAGSEVSTGQTLIGTTVELSPNDLLDVGAAYCALGHIHMHQEWFDGRVAYSGSPHRCNYGEKEAKGWRLVTLEDDGSFVSNEFVELPARRILLLECDLTGPKAEKLRGSGANAVVFALHDAGFYDPDVDVEGALVRFRYHVSPQELHLMPADAIEKVFHAAGAEEVVLEAVVEAATRVRSLEIVRAQTTQEKVDAYFQAKGIALDDPTRERIHSKLTTLEGGQRAAA